MSNPGAVGTNIELAYAGMPAPPCSTVEVIRTLLVGVHRLAEEVESGRIYAELNARAYPEAIALLDDTLEGTTNELGYVALAEGQQAMGAAMDARKQSQELLMRLSAIGGLMENLLEMAQQIGVHRQASQTAAAKYLNEIGVPHNLDKTA